MPLTHVFLALLFLQTPKPGSVAGIVTNSATGTPVRKAHITLSAGNASYTATTSASGQFAVAGVNPGVYFASAECPGFQPLRIPVPIRVAEEQSVENVAVQLTPLGVISGRVLDENGDPMAQMSVQALSETFVRMGRQMASGGMTQTNDLGEYRIFDLTAGRYFLMASNSSLSTGTNGRLHTDPIETAYVATWFPGVPDSSEATANQLAAGGEIGGIDIRMRKVRVYHIRGKALAPGSQGRLDATIWVEPCGPSGAASGNSGLYSPILQDGAFDASGIVPGTWCATINQMTDNTHGFYARQMVTVTDRDVNNVTLTVAPTAEIHGQVLVDGDAPTKPPQLSVQLEPLENPNRGVGVGVLPDGAFTLLNVQPASYRVTANSFGMYLKTVRFNGQDAPNGHIQVPPAGGQLTLLFAIDSGELSGNAETAGVWVTAVSSGSPGDVAAMVNAMPPNGNFVMRGLAPGDYQVMAWDTRETGLLQYAEFRKLFESRAVSVTIHPKGRETVSLTPIPIADIEAAKARLR